LPTVKAVLIKTRPGSYEEDGWSDDKNSVYRYSFKARKSKISYKEKANEVLIKQPQHLYPIFLFTESRNQWYFEGAFSVSEIEDTHVVLRRGVSSIAEFAANQDEAQYQEGELRYVTHLMAERSKEVVSVLKSTNSWACDICGILFNERYGVHYIEAHHKVPISTYSSKHTIKPQDLALLCPNCHKAVHVYMKTDLLEYEEIKEVLAQLATTSHRTCK
jgi:putative restriction endonuclease